MSPAASPRVSIVLHTRDDADRLETTLASVRAQSLDAVEVLVAGDGCTDDTATRVQGLEDPRLRWFDLPRAPGAGYAALNAALAEARAPLVAYLQAGDLWLPDHLERLVPLFDTPAIRWAYVRPLWVGQTGEIFPMFANLRVPRDLQHFLNRRSFLPACAVMHRRSCLEDVGLWPTDKAADADWVLWRRIIRRYGPHSVGFQRLPSTVHFARDDTGHPAPDAVRLMQAMARARGHWPEALCLPAAPDGVPPGQQALAQLCTAGPGPINRVRRAVASLQDDLAWAACQSPLFD
ncbi:MAG: glycosyltransferase [Pseudomonadota bacterium]